MRLIMRFDLYQSLITGQFGRRQRDQLGRNAAATYRNHNQLPIADTIGHRAAGRVCRQIDRAEHLAALFCKHPQLWLPRGGCELEYAAVRREVGVTAGSCATSSKPRVTITNPRDGQPRLGRFRSPKHWVVTWSAAEQYHPTMVALFKSIAVRRPYGGFVIGSPDDNVGVGRVARAKNHVRSVEVRGRDRDDLRVRDRGHEERARFGIQSGARPARAANAAGQDNCVLFVRRRVQRSVMIKRDQLLRFGTDGGCEVDQIICGYDARRRSAHGSSPPPHIAGTAPGYRVR
jgi:hypothetical protein